MRQKVVDPNDNLILTWNSVDCS